MGFTIQDDSDEFRTMTGSSVSLLAIALIFFASYQLVSQTVTFSQPRVQHEDKIFETAETDGLTLK